MGLPPCCTELRCTSRASVAARSAAASSPRSRSIRGMLLQRRGLDARVRLMLREQRGEVRERGLDVPRRGLVETFDHDERLAGAFARRALGALAPAPAPRAHHPLAIDEDHLPPLPGGALPGPPG